MTATLVEHAQFVDIDGLPLASGLLYIGTNGADPVATAGVTTIFSDRALTTSIANPQTLETDGRSENKIWVSGKYSIQVNNEAGVQKFQDLDAGSASSGTSSLFITSIVGGDTITGSSDQAITSYTANQQYVFLTGSVNSGAVQVNWDDVGLVDVVKNNDQALVDGDFAANQVVILAFNETNNNMEWVNHNNKVVQFSEGTAVVAAATTDIWATDGNTLHITGTTGITSFGTAPNVGARRTLIFDGVVTLTNSTNLALPGGADFTTAAGDILEVYADTVSQFDVRIAKKDGTAVAVITPPITAVFTSSAQTITSAGSLTIAHGLGSQPILVMAFLTNLTAEFGYSIGDDTLVSIDRSSSTNGMSIVPDATNLNIRFGSNSTVFQILNKTTGANASLTNASWELTVRAFL